MSQSNEDLSEKYRSDYIEQCTDGKELEQIYKALLNGQSEPPSPLEQLCRDRLAQFRPESELLKPIQNILLSPPSSIADDRQTSPIDVDAPNTLVNNQTMVPDGIQQRSDAFDRSVALDFEDDVQDAQLEHNQLAEDFHQPGNIVFEAANYTDASCNYNRNLEYDKSNLEVYGNRGAAHFNANPFEASKRDSHHIVSTDPIHSRVDMLQNNMQFDFATNHETHSNPSAVFTPLLDTNHEDRSDSPLSTPDSPDAISMNGHDLKAQTATELSDDDTTHRTMATSPTDNHQDFKHTMMPGTGALDDDHFPRSSIARKNGLEFAGTFRETSGYETNHVSERSPSHSFFIKRDQPSSSAMTIDELAEQESEPTSPIAPPTPMDQRVYAAIEKSKFSPLIQSWLREKASHSSHRYYSSYLDLPWSNSSIPYSMDNLENDLYDYQRRNDHYAVIHIAELMLKNGVLDYHYHSEAIVNILLFCAQAAQELNEPTSVIEYASEALEYNRMNTRALLYRAQALETTKCLLLSYADCDKVVQIDRRNFSAELLLEGLEEQLQSIYGEQWREHLSKEDSDVFMETLRMSVPPNQPLNCDFYLKISNQLYEDGCNVLAIKYYTTAIELDSTNLSAYAKRAACYVRVHELSKAIADCDRVLTEDANHFDALYCKARVLKLRRDDYEYRATLQACLKLQPKNTVLLGEYHSSRYQPIPRHQRRLRPHPVDSESESQSDISSFTWDELERMRREIRTFDYSELSDDLETLPLDDIRAQCSFALNLGEYNLDQVFSFASEKLLQVLINAGHAMIKLEQSSSGNPLFSYLRFCFNLFRQCAQLPSASHTASTLDDAYTQSLSALINLFSSLPEYVDNESLSKTLA